MTTDRRTVDTESPGRSAVTFAGLGFHVGVWAVGLPQIVSTCRISSLTLGWTLAGMALLGITALPISNKMSSYLGTSSLLALSQLPLAALFLGLAFVHTTLQFVLAVIVGGLATSIIDVAANNAGGECEVQSKRHMMSFFHGIFSLFAAIGAMLSGLSAAAGLNWRLVYLATSALLVLTALVTASIAGRPWIGRAVVRGTDHAFTDERPESDSNQIDNSASRRILIAAGSAIFLGYLVDGALEGYSGLFINRWLGGSYLAVGTCLALYHIAVLAGRLSNSRICIRLGFRVVLICGPIISALGILALTAFRYPWLGAPIFLLIGFAQAPIAPVSYALGMRSSTFSQATIVAALTGCGYISFIAAPAAMGIFSAIWGIDIALRCFSLASVAIPAVAIISMPRRLSGIGARKFQGSRQQLGCQMPRVSFDQSIRGIYRNHGRAKGILLDVGLVLILPKESHFQRACEMANAPWRGDGVHALRQTVWAGAASPAPAEFWAGDDKAYTWARNAGLNSELGPSVWRNLEILDTAEDPLWSVPAPGALCALRTLREAGYRIGAVSNSSSGQTERELRSTGLAEVFDVIVDSFVEKVEKPFPQIFERAARYLGVELRDCIVVGDDPFFDIRGGISAGALDVAMIDPDSLRPRGWRHSSYANVQEFSADLVRLESK